VLVEVRQALVGRRLGERPVAGVDLQGGERHTVVLHDDDLHPVGQRVAPDASFQLGTLRVYGHRCRHQRAERGEQDSKSHAAAWWR